MRSIDVIFSDIGLNLWEIEVGHLRDRILHGFMHHILKGRSNDVNEFVGKIHHAGGRWLRRV